MTSSTPTTPERSDVGDRSQRNDPLHLSHKAHRQLIGLLGLSLPVVLVVIAGILPTPELPRWKLLDSISAYYYTSATAVFVGILGALAVFLFSYQGYEKDVADRRIGKIGGISAAGVAFFPTVAPDGLNEPSWWFNIMRNLHYVSAAALFIVFIVFSLWLFRRTSTPKGQALPPDKRRRNRIYLFCGIIIVICVLWAGSAVFTNARIFWPEAIALWAFAVSWLVKGEIHSAGILPATS